MRTCIFGVLRAPKLPILGGVEGLSCLMDLGTAGAVFFGKIRVSGRLPSGEGGAWVRM
jgi:hypothetical protein